MAKTYSQDAAQNHEEGAAQKTDGRAIPLIGIVLFLIVAVSFGTFAFFRNRSNQPVSAPDAVQQKVGNTSSTGIGR